MNILAPKIWDLKTSNPKNDDSLVNYDSHYISKNYGDRLIKKYLIGLAAGK
jgi:hypothetical protein